MENHFFYYERCKNKNWNFYTCFKFFFDFYDEKGNCILPETEKRLYSFECKECRMITFLDFEQAGNEKFIVFLKQRLILINARRRFCDEEMKWEEKKNF